MTSRKPVFASTTRREALIAGATVGAAALLRPRNAAASTGLVKECDVGQGYTFKRDDHKTLGYIHSFVLGDRDISPDIMVVDPAAILGNGGTGA